MTINNHIQKILIGMVLCLFLSGFDSENNTIVDKINEFYRQINQMDFDKDINMAINLLTLLDGQEFVEFNGTLGPVTNYSLQLTIIQVLAQYKLMSNAISDSENEWSKLLITEPEKARDIYKMLDSTNPAIRWLGLYKLNQVEFAKIEQSIVDKVICIVQSDEYVIISRITIPSKEGYPRLVGNSKNDFKAPIQEMALYFLEKNGISITTDEFKMYENGVNYLKSLYSKHREPLLHAIFRLSKDSQARKVIQDQMKNATLPQEKKILEDFVWALENDIYSAEN